MEENNPRDNISSNQGNDIPQNNQDASLANKSLQPNQSLSQSENQPKEKIENSVSTQNIQNQTTQVQDKPINQTPPTANPISIPENKTSSTNNPEITPHVANGKELTPDQLTQVMKMRAQKQSSKKTWLLVGLVMLGLFLLFASLIVFLLSQGTQETNPFLKLLGIQALNRQLIILTLSNIGFGLFSFLLFIVSLVNLFRAGFSKQDLVLRKRSMIISAVSGLLLFFILFAWVFAYFYLSDGLVRNNNTSPQTTSFLTVPKEPLNLTAPVTIEFDASSIPVDNSAYTVLSYVWNFGDGDTANGKTTSHTYERKGTGEYEVVLVMKALEKKSQQTVEQEFKKIITIQNEKVKADFDANPESGSAPLLVKFDASKSKDPDGEIVSYEWDFDADNQFDDATGVTTEFEFKQLGNFTVRLRVTDNNNESDVLEKVIQVESANKLEGEISVKNKPQKFSVNQNYEFSAEEISSRFGPITKYEWSFGDGSPKESGRRITHSFKKAGSFDVVLTAEDSQENKGEFTLTVDVIAESGTPTAIIKANPALKDGVVSGDLPLTVQFNASDSSDPEDDIVEYNWDTDGDGKFDKSGTNISATFEKVGDNEVTLQVIDSEENEDEITVVVKVFDPGIKAVITADKPDGTIPLTVTFDASGSNYYQGKIVSYEWDFGDGAAKVLGDAIISHEYNNVGEFTALVTAIASDGKRASKSININVRPVALQACYTANNIKGPAPLIVTFEPRCSTGTISEYRWDFGYDGRTSKQRKPTHTFEQPGTYEVSLTVVDENNVVNTYKSTIVVTSVN